MYVCTCFMALGIKPGLFALSHILSLLKIFLRHGIVKSLSCLGRAWTCVSPVTLSLSECWIYSMCCLYCLNPVMQTSLILLRRHHWSILSCFPVDLRWSLRTVSIPHSYHQPSKDRRLEEMPAFLQCVSFDHCLHYTKLVLGRQVCAASPPLHESVKEISTFIYTFSQTLISCLQNPFMVG